MQRKRKLRIYITAGILTLLLAVGVCLLLFLKAPYGFARPVEEHEAQLRLHFVETAEQWLGTEGGSEAHAALLEIYNTHEPLAQGYAVKPQDAWCATFVSAAAIQCGLSDIIPTECGCQRQIGLWQQMGRWEEADHYEPLPGDIIYYCIANPDYIGDCTGHSDHVGIVAGTRAGFIKVIEGNCSNRVAYRYIPMDSYQIRGFALPDFSTK
ncbi:MAG: CHAP domain-containing protein [Ruminococcaceae bacterium]|nr:CHAP domain-containing protein [Oscillospiraceae bacterium]